MNSNLRKKNNWSGLFIAAALGTSVALMPLPSITTAASAQTAAPADTKVKTKKPPSPGQVALRDRQRKCGAEWKAAKAAGKIEKGMKWPQYWSACNKRLKSGS